MDANRFDNFLRSLATTPTRRNALRMLSGAAIASLLIFNSDFAHAKKGGRTHKGGKKGGKKSKGRKRGHELVTICHKGQTKDVPSRP